MAHQANGNPVKISGKKQFYEQTERKTESQQNGLAQAADCESVILGVGELLDAARRASVRVVNTLMTATYCEIGRRIVEHEQAGENRAGYGEELIEGLAP